MKISMFAFYAAATVAVPLAAGQREAHHQTRGGAARRRLDGDAKNRDAVISKKTADLLTHKIAPKKNDALAALVDVDTNADAEGEGIISDAWKYESSKWEARGIEANITLDVAAFDAAVKEWSKVTCGLGITATLFDKDANKVYQNSVGTMYTPFVAGGYSLSSSPAHGPLKEGWTGDTTFTPYSNSKVVASATYLAAVVDTGLGYLDEPISATFTDLKGTQVGQMTPRHMMSHTSGLNKFNREDPENDPYYSCKYDESKTLKECIQTHFFTDDSMHSPPGSVMGYNNEAFDILAILAVEKTGLQNWGQVFETYITGPLGMTDTSYHCPPVKSTDEKPGVAWGLCSTGNDFPKLIQALTRGGICPSGERVLSAESVRQIMTEGTGTAISTGDLLFHGADTAITRCYPRLVKGALANTDPSLENTSIPLTSVAGYGLGTMFFLGNQGEIKGHGGSTGGIWLIAPGRFSIYMTWMCAGDGTVYPAICAYAYPMIADIVNALETASPVTVKNGLGDWGIGGEDGPQEIDTCGGYIDYFSYAGVSSIKELSPPPTCDAKAQADKEVHPLVEAMNSAMRIL